MNSTAKIRGASCLSGAAVLLLGALPLATPAGAAVRSDFNGDGKADIFWRNTATGHNQIWLMNGAALLTRGSLPSLSYGSTRMRTKISALNNSPSVTR